jgi:hypothetical protein
VAVALLRRRVRLAAALSAALLAGAAGALVGDCGPFSDVTDVAFCPFIVEIFTLGITTGTTPTTYDPSSGVTRLQMAAFLSRTVDRAIQRGGSRAALNQFWTLQDSSALGMATLGGQTGQRMTAFDGADIWVANGASASVSRVRASDGALLETWTGATGAYGVLAAMGKVFATSSSGGTRLYRIDPAQPAGAVTTVASNIGSFSAQLAFDGGRVWTADGDGTVSIVTPSAALPWTVTTVTIGGSFNGVLWDGSSTWVTRDSSALLRLDTDGTVLQTVTIANAPRMAVFDGTNIWAPSLFGRLSIVRASSGVLLATLTGNGLGNGFEASFDGERVLVTNSSGTLSLWKAADLSPLGFLNVTGQIPIGVSSDGVNFWIAMDGPHMLARF